MGRITLEDTSHIALATKVLHHGKLHVQVYVLSEAEQNDNRKKDLS